MATTPRMTERYSNLVELVFFNTQDVNAWIVKSANTMDEAFAGNCNTMFTIGRGSTYRSRTIRQKRLGTIQYTNRGLARAHYDPEDFWNTVAASGTITVNNTLAAGDTVTINGHTLTGFAGARTPGANNFNATLGTTNALATEIAAALNDAANAFAADIIATANLNAISVSAVTPGPGGNDYGLAAVTAPAGRISVSGASLSGGYTMPHDYETAYMRVAEVNAAGDTRPDGPILIIPTSGFFTNTRPKLTVSGTAPNVAATVSGNPPDGSLHFVLPRFADSMDIVNSGGASIYISFSVGEPEFEVMSGQTHHLADAAVSEVFIRGDGATVDFRMYIAIVNAEMA